MTLDKGHGFNLMIVKVRGGFFSRGSKEAAAERQIDEIVYKLYNLTLEDIKIIEGENKNEKKSGLPVRCTQTGNKS